MIDPMGLLLQSTPEPDAAPNAAPGAAVMPSTPEAPSDAAGGASEFLSVAVLVALAAIAIACIRRWRLHDVPREPSGRMPREALFGAILFLIAYVVGMLGASLPAALLPSDSPWTRLAIGSVANLFQWIAAIAFLSSQAFADGPTAVTPRTRAITAGVIGLLLALPIVLATGTILGLLLPHLGLPKAPEVSHETLRIVLEQQNLVFTAATLAQVVILVPLAEEALFRGLFQPSLRAARFSGAEAIAATSVVFALIHWPSIPADGRATGLVMLVLLSVALGVLRERTGGFLAPAVAHAIFNGLNLAMALMR
ncbi:MAG: CPBP family intramembrane metalloprotease [Planctomycetaceae bacterium]|nr:CPBP family intramembrane metalloprotease [Planctomycetaceae bacterium]